MEWHGKNVNKIQGEINCVRGHSNTSEGVQISLRKFGGSLCLLGRRIESYKFCLKWVERRLELFFSNSQIVRNIIIIYPLLQNSVFSSKFDLPQQNGTLDISWNSTYHATTCLWALYDKITFQIKAMKLAARTCNMTT